MPVCRIAGKPHRPDLPGKHISHCWLQRIGLMLQACQAQLLSVPSNPVHWVNLFAHVCPGILCKLCAARAEGFRDFEHARLPATKALLHPTWLIPAGRDKMNLPFVTPRLVRDVKP